MAIIAITLDHVKCPMIEKKVSVSNCEECHWKGSFHYTQNSFTVDCTYTLPVNRIKEIIGEYISNEYDMCLMADQIIEELEKDKVDRIKE